MNEMAFGFRIAEYLSVSARSVDGEVAARLRKAREQALAVHGSDVPRVSRAIRNPLAFRACLAMTPVVRSMAMAAVLLGVFLVGGQWVTVTRVEALQQVDAALLMDDLPIEAYLDPEFRIWLSRESRS